MSELKEPEIDDDIIVQSKFPSSLNISIKLCNRHCLPNLIESKGSSILRVFASDTMNKLKQYDSEYKGSVMNKDDIFNLSLI